MNSLSRDLVGRQFGRWTVVEKGPIRGHNRLWRCVCTCGTQRDVLGFTLRKGASQSCGCLNAERASSRGKHHLSGTSEYDTWHQMINRCYNSAFIYYPLYGGRGISVCDRWRHSVEHFYADMGPKPSPEHTLERIDNDASYSPENCRWATKKEQARNRRSTRFLTHNGETLSMAEWAERIGVSPNAMYMRLRKGWSVERAVTTPRQQGRWGW